MMQPDLPDYLSAARLDGRGYVVLGAGGGGLGNATCEALSGAGAEIICVDQSSEEAQAVAQAVGGMPYVCDVTNRDEMGKLFATSSDHFGDRFAGVVDIVGMSRPIRLDAADDSFIAGQFDVVFRHALLAVQIAAPMLARKGGGTLSFIGSLTGIAAVPDVSLYGMAKAALLQLVRSAAFEYGPAGVRVNAVMPGYMVTPRLLENMSPDLWARIAANNPLRRVAYPQDVAKALLFLASDLADYVTGNVMVLDGGTSSSLLVPGSYAPRDPA